MRTRLGVLLLTVLAASAHADRVAPGAVARAETKVEAKVDAKQAPGVLDPKNLASLTDDPVLAKADRVDGDEAKGLVAFTFDDGPNPETTPAVIDALEKYDVPATFFIVTQRIAGKHGARSREILERLIKAGFELGSHSVSHKNLKKASATTLQKEIDGSLKTLAPQANRAIGLFRPPFGAFGPAGRKHLARLGLTDVRWSVDTLDWQARNADKLRKKTVSMIVKQHGGVVLMHDVKPITAKIIADVLDDLEAENCRRLDAKETPIVPVSIHYFLKDGKTARAIPPAVHKRTETYRARLPARCAKRPRPAPPPPRPAPAK